MKRCWISKLNDGVIYIETFSNELHLLNQKVSTCVDLLQNVSDLDIKGITEEINIADERNDDNDDISNVITLICVVYSYEDR